MTAVLECLEERVQTRDHAPSVVGGDPKFTAAVWRYLRGLVTLIGDLPEDPVNISEASDERLNFQIRLKNGSVHLLNRFYDASEYIEFPPMKNPWGEIAKVSGGFDKCHHHAKKRLEILPRSTAKKPKPDASNECNLIMQVFLGGIAIWYRDVPKTKSKESTSKWQEVARISAAWIADDLDLLNKQLADLLRDITQQLRCLEDETGERKLSGYGHFLPALLLQSTDLPVATHGRWISSAPASQVKTDHPTLELHKQNGRMCFTSSAELGVPARYYLDNLGNWRPDVEETVIIMHFGQSNAGVNQAGGVVKGAIRKPYHIVNLNDGRGARGLLGSAPKYEATEFVPVEEFSGASVQSVVGVAAGIYLENLIAQGKDLPQVAVRAEAAVGQPFIGQPDKAHIIGLHKTADGEFAPCFLNLVASLRKTIEIAARTNAPVSRIYIPFTHQEANRADAIDSYCAEAFDTFRDVEKWLEEYNIPIIWLLDQAGGTTSLGGSGGEWTSRLALHQLADMGDNIHLIQPRYAYPMFDKTHWSNHGKVLYGEFLGHMITALESGEKIDAARVISYEVSARNITLTFDNQTPLQLDQSQHPVSNSVMGFTLASPSRFAISDVKVTGDHQITICLDTPPSADEDLELRYAYRRRVLGENRPDWVVATGALRESWQKPSTCFPDKTHLKWIPAFTVNLRREKQGVQTFSDHLGQDLKRQEEAAC